MDGTAIQDPPKTISRAPSSPTRRSGNTPPQKQSIPASMALVIIAGLTVSIGCATVWAIITAVTGYQIGWMAIGIGFAVGYAIRLIGNGQAPVFGIAGAGLSLFGCMLGNLFTIFHYIAQEEQQSFLSAMAANLGSAPSLLVSAAEPIDLLFYGLAVYYGYKLSLRSCA